MSWVKEVVQGIKAGKRVQVRPRGGSMRGRIESGQLVTIVPASFEEIEVDDVVFVRWKGNYLLHLAKEISAGQVLIGNNIGKTNGWVSGGDILGKVISVSE